MTAHQRLVEHLAEGLLDKEDHAHAARCPACRALLAAEGPDVFGAEAEAALLDAARRELKRRAMPWWLPAVLLGLGNGLLAAAAVFILQAGNWQASAARHGLLLTAGIWLAVLATLGALFALAPRRQWVWAVYGLAAGAPPLVLLSVGGRLSAEPLLAGAHCLTTCVSLSALPLLAGAWVLTRVAYSPMRALAVGLGSAGVGLLVLQLHCDGAMAHVLTFHLLPWAALGVLAIALRRVLPTRSYAP